MKYTIVLAVLSLAATSPAQEPPPTPPDQLLLKDYTPRSIYRIPATEISKARYPAIDVHSHAYAKTPFQVAQWLRTMDAVGVEKSVVMVSATGAAFDAAVELYSKYPDRFELWCGIDYTGFDQPGFAARAIAELERCHKLGAVGVGELSDKGKGLSGFHGNPDAPAMHIDDPRLAPVLERCAELGLPVNIHVGEDKWMYEPADRFNDGLMNAAKWHIPAAPGTLGHGEVIATLGRAVAKHPGVTWIACHLANTCYDLTILGRMLDKHPNLHADLGARYGELAPVPRYAAAFLTKYQDRVLYGTDMGMSPEMYHLTFRILESADEHFYNRDYIGYHWPLHGFALGDDVLKKIYRTNALELFSSLRQP